MSIINPILRHLPRSTGMGRRILVCSIGNHGAAYANTRHSAGHTITDHLQETFGSGPFTKNKVYGGGKISLPSLDQTYTLWQSQSFMNVSGKGVKAAWKAYLQGLALEERQNAVLVIVHDELQVALGKVKARKTGSASGHNGLISIINSFNTKDFYRIGVGIGRPNSKDPADVSEYVLGKIEPRELKILKEISLKLVIEELKKLAELPELPSSPRL